MNKELENMKLTKSIILLALLFGISNVWADNKLTVKDVIITKEGTAVMAVETDFEKDDFIGYQLEVTLPKGLAFTLDASNKVVATSYTELDVEGNAYSTSETSTTYRFIASKMGNPRIPSGSYVLFSASIVSDGTLNVGDVCTCSLTNIRFSDSKQQKEDPEDVNFNVTISNKVILDENTPVVPPATDEEVDILVKRTIKAGQWSTICLPFDMTEEQVKAAFGDDVQIAELDTDEGYTKDDDGSIVVNFIDTDLTDGLYGNYPYIIKTSGDISEFEVTALIAPEEDEAVATYTTGKGSKKRTVGTFTGTYHAGTLIPADNLFLSGNKFYYSVGKTKSKAFRAYFWFEDVLDDMSNASSRITLSFNANVTTGIQDHPREEIAYSLYYDLQGRRVNGQLEKGLYIREGKKVVIK